MPQDSLLHVRKHEAHGNRRAHHDEAQSLLPGTPADNQPDAHSHISVSSDSDSSPPPIPRKDPPPLPRKDYPPRRQSSLINPAVNGTPRTPRTANRVRFEIEDERRSSTDLQVTNGHVQGPRDGDWSDVEEEDYMSHHAAGGGRSSTGQRAPLLTDIEAPSVTVATAEGDDGIFRIEDLLETSRPKSGMRSAFMNMANSIIGAGIIGQPYAFRQAGLTTGILLLVGLTITVDWTIRLIVINSKLSGANSFQATMEHCFGVSGLIAISIAQWAL
ncbi:hypothetical protein MMC19_004974 [Ptychographa xylographoides]|nr:hypothetical protein [Ptychographa xylographoides]